MMRVHPKCMMKMLITVVIVSLTFIYISWNSVVSLSYSESTMVPPQFPHFDVDPDHLPITRRSTSPPPTVLATTRPDIPAPNIAAIKRFIEVSNSKQYVQNFASFSNTSDISAVIVVQVHNRIMYLKALIGSLASSRHIEDTLLIFSHDFYDPEINALIKSIKFCKVLQIFYPHMIQIYPNVFPGADPKDCPRDYKRSMNLNCTNADFPDKYGHYREAKFTQTKHHWFWKLNMIFDKLTITKHFDGAVLLLEEDHFVSNDFLHVMALMYQHNKDKDCTIITLGLYLPKKIKTWKTSSKEIQSSFWQSTKHNMGMSMDRRLWLLVKHCGEEFCRYDDYNWDWSLQYIFMKCMKTRVKVLYVLFPRVFHIGTCGVHHKKTSCNPKEVVDGIEVELSARAPELFPAALRYTNNLLAPNQNVKPNGGWGDHRDHLLCASFLSSSISSPSQYVNETLT